MCARTGPVLIGLPGNQARRVPQRRPTLLARADEVIE
jgi:hypothetical protein